MKKLLILTAAIIFLQGCSFKITKMDPMPNISINESNESIALVLNDKIKDNYIIPENRGIKGAEVTDWRKSLTSGFENAFGDYYTTVNKKEGADLVLVLKRADIEFAATSVASHGGAPAIVSSIESHITFNSTLKDANGKTIARLAKTAASKSSVASPDYVTDNVKSAVESMYELIAEKMFSKN